MEADVCFSPVYPADEDPRSISELLPGVGQWFLKMVRTVAASCKNQRRGLTAL